jgi:hypothetical protein
MVASDYNDRPEAADKLSRSLTTFPGRRLGVKRLAVPVDATRRSITERHPDDRAQHVSIE